MVPVTTIQFCRFSEKEARDDSEMNEHDCVLVNFYLRTLNFEIPIITFMCHKTQFSFWFFSPSTI